MSIKSETIKLKTILYEITIQKNWTQDFGGQMLLV